MRLERLGWSGFFSSQPYTGVPGRVAAAIRERFLVWTEAGQAGASISGRLRQSASAWPVVGDWVALETGAPVIQEVLDRRTILSRRRPGRATTEQVLAANIDVLFIVSGLDRDYNKRRLERYLVVAGQSGARPVILLNKSDLAPDYRSDLPGIMRRLSLWSGAPVLPVSAQTGDGFSGFEKMLQHGETAALIGSSGAGKSTILNRLLGDERQATREVRPDDHRGRHTTTARSMFLMPGGWLLIDMPGLREVQLWASTEHLDAGFDDVRQLAANCRFRDCTHTGEPGCAVCASSIDQGRLENYQKMQRELDYLDRKADKRLMSEARARWKVIHKAMRNNPKPGAKT